MTANCFVHFAKWVSRRLNLLWPSIRGGGRIKYFFQGTTKEQVASRKCSKRPERKSAKKFSSLGCRRGLASLEINVSLPSQFVFVKIGLKTPFALPASPQLVRNKFSGRVCAGREPGLHFHFFLTQLLGCCRGRGTFRPVLGPCGEPGNHSDPVTIAKTPGREKDSAVRVLNVVCFLHDRLMGCLCCGSGIAVAFGAPIRGHLVLRGSCVVVVPSLPPLSWPRRT